MVWYSHLFQNFPQFIVIHTVKGFGIVNKAEIDVFLELSCLMAPKKCLCSGVSICGKRYFASVINLPCGGPLLILIFPDGPSVITRVLLRAQQDVKEIWRCCAAGCDDNEGTMSQGIQVTFRNWKSWGNEFSRRKTSLWTHFRLLTSRTIRC